MVLLAYIGPRVRKSVTHMRIACTGVRTNQHSNENANWRTGTLKNARIDRLEHVRTVELTCLCTRQLESTNNSIFTHHVLRCMVSCYNFITWTEMLEIQKNIEFNCCNLIMHMHLIFYPLIIIFSLVFFKYHVLNASSERLKQSMHACVFTSIDPYKLLHRHVWLWCL